jgi:hypothetical protein
MMPKTVFATQPASALTRRWGLSQCQEGEGMLTDARTRTSRLEGSSLIPGKGVPGLKDVYCLKKT